MSTKEKLKSYSSQEAAGCDQSEKQETNQQYKKGDLVTLSTGDGELLGEYRITYVLGP